MVASAILNVFIDTEFTDFLDPDLISLGMAAESGEEFYGEVPYADHKCSQFVREGVLDLLGQIPHAYYNSHYELACAVVQWLELVRNKDQVVNICVDAQIDWDLFSHALDYRVPPWARMRHIGYYKRERAFALRIPQEKRSTRTPRPLRCLREPVCIPGTNNGPRGNVPQHSLTLNWCNLAP